MRSAWHRVAVLAGFIGLWALAGPSRAADVADFAGFFSDKAIQDANARIATLQLRHHVEMRVETFKSVPEEQAAAVAKMDHTERNRFFHDWMVERAKKFHDHGLDVLICRKPGHIEVGVSKTLRDAGFTTADISALRKLLVGRFEKKQYDEGLREALDFVAQTATDHKIQPHAAHAIAPAPAHRTQPPHPARYASQPPAGVTAESGGWMAWLVVGFVGILAFGLLSMILRGLFSGGGGAGGYGGMGGGGGGMGGGWLGSLVAGMFGAAAGNWIYDSFFGGHAHAATPDQPLNHGDAPLQDSNAPEDFETTGDDFDDQGGSSGGEVSSDGGDFGNDDVGGGDFGGGDFGGGDDFGGGGDF